MCVYSMRKLLDVLQIHAHYTYMDIGYGDLTLNLVYTYWSLVWLSFVHSVLVRLCKGLITLCTFCFIISAC